MLNFASSILIKMYMQTKKFKTAVLTLFCLTTTLMSYSQTNVTIQNNLKQMEKVNSIVKEHVTFNNNGVTMVGNLYYHEHMDRTKKYPAIVCTHAAGMVKEQASGLYAQKLSEQGFITLAFDASHQGESGGEPRFLEAPVERVEDIKSAVDYLTTLPFVDAERIGAFGICAGSGYTIQAATTDHRIKAVVGTSGTDAGAAIREGWLGNQPVAVQLQMLEAVSKERTAVANGAQPTYGTYVPESIDSKAPVTMNEAYEYYRTPRCQKPNSKNKVLLLSLDKIMAFDAFKNMETLLTQPLLMVVGSKSDAMYLTDRAISKATSSVSKEKFVVEGATHIDLYDKQPYVDQAVKKMAGFFHTYLK